MPRKNENNPLKAGLVSSLDDYQWSSYLSYVDSQNKIVKNDDILKIFSDDLLQARYQYIDFSQKKEERYRFLEYKEHNREKKEINTYLKVKSFQDQFLKRNKLELDSIFEKSNKGFQDKLIQELRERSIYSDREIAEFLNIDRGIIYRAGRNES